MNKYSTNPPDWVPKGVNWLSDELIKEMAARISAGENHIESAIAISMREGLSESETRQLLDRTILLS